MRRFLLRLLNVLRPNHAEPDLDREVASHLALLEDEYRRRGMTADDARIAARRALGGVDRAKEAHRDARSLPWLDDARRDVPYALRSLARNPGFTTVAVLTLALGIGANSAIFSVVNAVLLRPLPFGESDRVVRIFEHVTSADSGPGPSRRSPLAAADVAAFQAQTRTLSHVGTHIPTVRTLTGGETPVRLIGARVSPSLLSMPAMRPLMGRTFQPHEDQAGADAVVILSHTTWQRHLGADPKVVGRSIALDGRPYVVVGVMPPGFSFLDPQDEFWMPFPTTGPFMRQRMSITARLQDGVSIAAAAAEINSLIPRLRGDAKADPSAPPSGDDRFVLVPLIDLVVAPVKPALLLLAAAVGLVLLIACVNVANLLFARAAAREREMAVRLALGAGRGRVIRQVLTESGLLAIIGGLAGAGLALGGVFLLRTLGASLPRRDLGPGIGLPRLDEISLDGSVLAFTLGASLLTGVLCGVVPAIRQSRPRPMDLLREGMTSPASGFSLVRGHRSRGLLVVAEIAMAMMLFVGGGLLIHGFLKLTSVDPGYEPDGVLTFQLALPPGRPDAQLRTLADQLVARVESLPDVQAAGYTESLPMTRVSARRELLRTTPERPRGPQRPPMPGTFTADRPDTRLVGGDFMQAMGIRIAAGRGFRRDDGPTGSRVMLINQTLARSGMLGDDSIGKQIYAMGDRPWEVVGIVGDVRQLSLTQNPDPQIFIHYRQVPGDEPLTGIGLYFSIRTGGDPMAIASSVRAVVHQLDPVAIVENIAPMDALVSNSIVRQRLYAVLLGLFASVAVVLAAIGIYGVMAFLVTQRTREIGIRMALGAQRAEVLGLVLRQSTALTAAGVALGLAGAVAASRYLEGMLFGITPLDAPTFITVPVLFALVALLASYVPARRATRVDPVVALRAE